jgi:hypothetical protein
VSDKRFDIYVDLIHIALRQREVTRRLFEGVLDEFTLLLFLHQVFVLFRFGVDVYVFLVDLGVCPKVQVWLMALEKLKEVV